MGVEDEGAIGALPLHRLAVAAAGEQHGAEGEGAAAHGEAPLSDDIQ
jgi:hypothetical protein